jgi:hypothetical protein
MRVHFLVLLGAVLLANPVPAQTPAPDAEQAVGAVQKAVVRALRFGQGDLERFRGARGEFTPAGWTAFMKHLDGFLDANGAPAYTSSFEASGGPTIISQGDGVLQLTMAGTLKQTQSTSSTTYPIVVEVRAVGKPLKIDQLKQTICGGRSATPCQ